MSGDSGEEPPEVETSRGDGQSEFVYELDAEESASEGVVNAVSAVTNRPPTRLSPLYRTVDTDALDRLSDRRATGSGTRTLNITFEYEGYTVTVDDGHRVKVCA